MLPVEQEKEILKSIKKGDNEAFAKLYDIYTPKLYRFIRLKVNSREMAQDLTSETFLKIWQYLQEQKKIKERFHSLMYKIARNLVIDFYRTKSSREILIEDNFEEFSMIEDDDNIAELTIRREEILQAKKAISQIHPHYQDVIVLYFLDELSISEIAEILGKNEGTVRVLIHRAVNALKKTMKAMETN